MEWRAKTLSVRRRLTWRLGTCGVVINSVYSPTRWGFLPQLFFGTHKGRATAVALPDIALLSGITSPFSPMR